MTLPTFLFVADALRLEDGVGFHVETAPGVRAPEPAPSPADVAAQNAQAMQAFTAMMGGVQKRRRR